jgi:uncharacterized protein (TIGR02598 family)
MKRFQSRFYHPHRRGFSLAEASLSIGLLSFGFLSLAPLLALGLKSARQARDNRATAQIAQTLVEEARQGTLPSGAIPLDFQGQTCDPALAIYTAQATSVLVTAGPGGAANLTRLTLRIAPLGAPDRVRIYAVVFSAKP